MSIPVSIDSDALEHLLGMAKRGDVAGSQRRLRHAFRHVEVCSGAEREPECFSCQAYTAAENALADRLTA